MMRSLTPVLSFLIILGAVFLSFYTLMPSSNEEKYVPPSEFSVDRAMTPLLEITKKPHYTGSDAHEEVRSIIIKELHKAGLEPHIQEGFSLNSASKTLAKPVNIVAKFPGTNPGKSVLLLSHYDSALVPSFGAADAASGVVTILESVRAYLASGARPRNDIIVLFTDAEEFGLDGARLFVEEHPWAKNVAVALNFEARGTSGPGNMILETNGGNAELLKHFLAANPKYPVASSLMYSVYKMLPNDTDSTILREEGDIDGYFFAFIDNHFHYHTALDTYYNLDRNSLMHQGSYLLPLLHHFADADLSNLKSGKDHVYFNFPFAGIINYPFHWVIPMVVIAGVVFVVLMAVGFRRKKIYRKAVTKGFLVFTACLILTGLVGYFGWKLIGILYPSYAEIQQGFPYNGHWYIAFFVSLSIAVVTFILGRGTVQKEDVSSFLVAPLFYWLVLNALLAIYLKGAGYFIIPVFFALAAFRISFFQNPPVLLFTLLAIPALVIFSPLIQFFPVGLGLKMVFISCLFTTLLLGMIWPVWATFNKRRWISKAAAIIAFGFFITAHFSSNFNDIRKKPNSLVYFEDADKATAYWTTYDNKRDSWNSQRIPTDTDNFPFESPYSKYGIVYQSYSETSAAGFEKANVAISVDTVIDGERHLKFSIQPQRRINFLELQTENLPKVSSLSFNGHTMELDSLPKEYRGTANNALIRYLVPHSQEPLDVSIQYIAEDNLSLKILEYSFDLMEQEKLDVPPRETWMMPKPFVLTDAVVVKQEVLF
ncbi:MAG TPA: M20/M25/M40 family metallo-hydrolase [Flavobacteriaceae bacterium]|nr:M20/M25/M40 family metallo-hydrolase [Flavobacteriaceae bacterium]